MFTDFYFLCNLSIQFPGTMYCPDFHFETGRHRNGGDGGCGGGGGWMDGEGGGIINLQCNPILYMLCGACRELIGFISFNT